MAEYATPLTELAVAAGTLGAAYVTWRLILPKLERIRPNWWRAFCSVTVIALMNVLLERIYGRYLLPSPLFQGHMGKAVFFMLMADLWYRAPGIINGMVHNNVSGTKPES